MNTVDLIADFTTKPYPLWDNELTKSLVADKLEKLTLPYSLTGCILKDMSVQEETVTLLPSNIKVVFPSKNLQSFYQEHGLVPLSVNGQFHYATEQIRKALDVFNEVPAIPVFISHIVNSIQILQAEHHEIDISYSHPDVPFSIFVSVCEKSSAITDLRLAESILHEAMHLLLTLIERTAPMVYHSSTEIYYSPWRDEDRPIRGVLHGLFVFRAVLDFFKAVRNKHQFALVFDYIENRINCITSEIKRLEKFPNCTTLTIKGSILAKNLLFV